MTSKDKEEWNYRFKDNLEWNLGSPFTYMMIIWLTIQVSIMSYFLVLKEYIDVALTLSSVMSLATSITACMIIVWGVDIAIKVGVYVYWSIKAGKWLKEKGYKK